MLLQLHWQDRSNLKHTEFVAQTEIKEGDDYHEWLADLMKRRGSEMPEGWMPLLCNQDSEYFALTPSDAR